MSGPASGRISVSPLKKAQSRAAAALIERSGLLGMGEAVFVVSEAFKKKTARAFAAVANKKLVGIVTLQNSRDHSEIEVLAVDEHWRRRGVARDLMAEAEKYIGENWTTHGKRDVRLHDETNRNEVRSNFYEKMGYAVFDAKLIEDENPCREAFGNCRHRVHIFSPDGGKRGMRAEIERIKTVSPR